MEKTRALLASFLLAAMASQAFFAMVEPRSVPQEKATQDGVKKPDCVTIDPHVPMPGVHPPTTPAVPSPPSHGGYRTTPPPSHGGFGTPPTTPAAPGGGYGTPAPSHRGSGASPTPATPSTGGGYGTPTPSHGGYGTSPTPAEPSHGGYGGTTPTYGSTPGTPSHGGHGGTGDSTPTPLIPVDPHSPDSLPASCDYWRTHPMAIWEAIGRWPATVGNFFGTAGSLSAGGPDVSLQDALANTRVDGAGALLREGTAALLNSMASTSYPYTTQQVKDAFASASTAGSDGAAAAQALAFKKANEGKV